MGRQVWFHFPKYWAITPFQSLSSQVCKAHFSCGPSIQPADMRTSPSNPVEPQAGIALPSTIHTNHHLHSLLIFRDNKCSSIYTDQVKKKKKKRVLRIPKRIPLGGGGKKPQPKTPHKTPSPWLSFLLFQHSHSAAEFWTLSVGFPCEWLSLYHIQHPSSPELCYNI